jgi:predicted membrane protein (TIGR00267 family)
MGFLGEIRLLLRITRSQEIARRYFIVNGFDGALAMLGLTMGFFVGDEAAPKTMLTACMGTAIALMMSGLSSAYVSESAERRRELAELEQAMVTDLDASAHAKAARLVPLLIAAVNGLSPFILAMVIVSPLWLHELGVTIPLSPLKAAIAIAFASIFALGIFLGHLSQTFWLWSALRTLLIAGVTAGIILALKL